MYENLGEEQCKLLLGFHSFTLCDFNPSFHKKGKIRPFRIVKQSDEFINASIVLSRASCDDDTKFKSNKVLLVNCMV